MRVLAVSNLYPPAFIGGYELHCQQAVEGLRRKGHDVEVLTATAEIDEPDPLVHRVLRHHDAPPADGPGARWHLARARRYLNNAEAAAAVIGRARPDVIVSWSPARVGLAVLAPAAQAGIPVVHFVDDFAIAEELALLRGGGNLQEGSGPIGRLAYRRLRRRARSLSLEHMVFVSHFMERAYRDHDVAFGPSTVIHQGARFVPPTFDDLPAPTADLVSVGRIEQTKGTHVAVEALRLLRERHGRTDARLTLIGGTTAEGDAYLRRVRDDIRRGGLDEAVDLLGPRPPAKVFELLPRHRVFLFTSTWEEPGPATPIEAMGHGVPVVSTDVGGMRDYVRDGIDGFVVPRKDAAAMAAASARLLEDEALWGRMRRSGWEQVSTYFSDSRFVGQVEELLVSVAGGRT